MVVGPLIRGALRLYGAYKGGRELSHLGSLDPRSIVEDARNPEISAASVLARAAARSSTGALVQRVEELLAQRPSRGVLSEAEQLLEGE